VGRDEGSGLLGNQKKVLTLERAKAERLYEKWGVCSAAGLKKEVPQVHTSTALCATIRKAVVYDLSRP